MKVLKRVQLGLNFRQISTLSNASTSTLGLLLLFDDGLLTLLTP